MGKFTFTQTEIPGVVVIEPQVFGDDRGYFMETYQKDQFAAEGLKQTRKHPTQEKVNAIKDALNYYNLI